MTTPSNAEKLELDRLIGQRLKQARVMNNLTQKEAAPRLGFATGSKLSLAELGDIRYAPRPWLIVAAANLYQVSTDYLMGLTENFDPGDRPGCFYRTSRWMLDKWEQARERDLEVLRQLHRRVDCCTTATKELTDAAALVDAVLTRFRELNEGFDDMPAGARLSFAIEQLSDAAQRAQLRLDGLTADLEMTTDE